MDPWRTLVLQATGREFSPDDLGVSVEASFAPNTIATFGAHRAERVPYGGALYRVPDGLPDADGGRLAAALTHLVEVVRAFRAAGAERFILHMNRAFHERCNEEFTRDELRLLSSLDCDFFYTARDAGAS
jgi:hypothetical protein